MSSKSKGKQPVALLKTSINTLFTHPHILFPYAIIAFYEFLIFEVLFFSPRFPLINFSDRLSVSWRGRFFSIILSPIIFLLSGFKAP